MIDSGTIGLLVFMGGVIVTIFGGVCFLYWKNNCKRQESEQIEMQSFQQQPNQFNNTQNFPQQTFHAQPPPMTPPQSQFAPPPFSPASMQSFNQPPPPAYAPPPYNPY